LKLRRKERYMENKELFVDGKPNLMHCPFCGKPVEIHGGPEEWSPTFYDPDSGGDPYYVDCNCGLHFSIGCREIEEVIKAWNHRHELARLSNLLEQVAEEIENLHGRETEVSEKIRQLI